MNVVTVGGLCFGIGIGRLHLRGEVLEVASHYGHGRH